jgi:catechol 2,3-dioxygenase
MRTGARPAMADHAVSEALYLYDPDGLGIEVYADRPRSAWETRGDELVMITEPLDLADVISAGQGTAWTGTPAGTTMGHVHLHVGDVHAAEAFYHAALGFEKTVWSYPGALFMSAGGYHHHLAVNTWSAGPSAPEDEARLIEWELVVPEWADARIAAERLARAGFEPELAGDASWMASDPWGTQLRVVAGEAKDARAT